MDAQEIISLQIECAQACAEFGHNEPARAHLQIAFNTLHENFEQVENWQDQVDGIMALWRQVSAPRDRISGCSIDGDMS